MNANEFFKKYKEFCPSFLRKWIRTNVYLHGYDEYSFSTANPYLKDPDIINYSESCIKVGIIFSSMHYHRHWIAACHDLKISFQIIYLNKSDWINQIEKSMCDIVLVWPDVATQHHKIIQDEQLRIIGEDMGIAIFPSLKSIWLYENKRIQNYWLRVNKFNTPHTWVFYEYSEVRKFLEEATYPLVFKSNLGASSSGVYIIEDRKEAIRKAKDFLRKGFLLKGSGSFTRQKGSLYIQEYLEKVKEWRMVRIWDSYFGHGKDLKGQFHSGSGKVNWDLPPMEAFTMLRKITDKGNFMSMDLDLFEDSEGTLYVNELQTVFGNSIAKEQLLIDGVPGRMVINSDDIFEFEPGDFCKNHLCNLRLSYLVRNKY